jgi:hypothetical protein
MPDTEYGNDELLDGDYPKARRPVLRAYPEQDCGKIR